MNKAALREAAAARRASAKAEGPGAGDRLAATFPQALFPNVGAVVAGYWPFRTEIDPRPLMRALAARGCRLALPVTPPKSSDLPLTFRVWNEADVLGSGAFATQEPSTAAPLVEPALVLVPLLAFDRFGGRLGYGAGHYDRTLPALRARRRLRAVGLAFAAQEVDRVPVAPHDAPLDGIATEIAYIEAMRLHP